MSRYDRARWAVQDDDFERRHPVAFTVIATVVGCALFFGWPYLVGGILVLMGYM